MTIISAYAATTGKGTYPISSYPNGTYYTTSGGNCTSSHKYCKSYAGGKQCFAFAKYAYDQYSHRSEWTNISGDKYISGRKIDTLENFKKWMQNDIKYGSYVRLTIKGDDTTGHSFIFISASSDGVKMYDANYTGYCKVDTHTVPYKTLFDKYEGGKILEAYAHNFTKKLNYNNVSYHKIACSSSGCTGYEALESHTLKYTQLNSTSHTVTCTVCGYSATRPHVAKTTGSNKTCSQCGATGIIAGEGLASIEDENS